MKKKPAGMGINNGDDRRNARTIWSSGRGGNGGRDYRNRSGGRRKSRIRLTMIMSVRM